MHSTPALDSTTTHHVPRTTSYSKINIHFSSTKDIKVLPVLKVLEHCFKKDYQISTSRERIGETETKIPSQPFGRRETKLGSERRAEILSKKILYDKDNMCNLY